MDIAAIFEVILTIGLLVVMAIPLGRYMARIYSGDVPKSLRWLNTVEQIVSIPLARDYHTPQTWKQYALSLGLFNLIGFVVLTLLQLLQHWLPLNTEDLGPVSFWGSINTSISFVTNTNWQAYSGEDTLTMLTQMLGMGVQNFLSAATGMAVIVAVVRGLVSTGEENLGNFWCDLTRSVVYILLPLCIIVSSLLVTQGVTQTLAANNHVITLNGTEQVVPLGPAASQIAIKQLGTNGGGYYGTNSAHPFENPTPLSNLIELIAILLIPAAIPFMYGRMVKNRKHGRVIFYTMFTILIVGLGVSLWSEYSAQTIPGMLEGKELRFGIGSSVTWSVFTTASSNGSVNTMHDSMSPLSGLIELFNMQIGEVAFGGVGSGMYGMILYIILTVFLAGLMVGRTPEYLGKKIEKFEISMAAIGILAPGTAMLLFTALASMLTAAAPSIFNGGPHGFSEILYTFSSAAGNNGSAFAGYSGNTDYVNITTSIAMLVGRYMVIFPVLAIAGSMATKKISPVSMGTFRTDSALFGVLLLGIIVVVGALTFLPALSVGPIVEHLLVGTGRFF